VLDALVSRVDVVADRRADTGKLGGGDGGAHTGTADEDSTVGVPALNGLATECPASASSTASRRRTPRWSNAIATFTTGPYPTGTG
jgi:hypothetical protein